MSTEAIRMLQAYHWPGNARELRNVLERALSFGGGTVLSECELAAAMSTGPPRHDDIHDRSVRDRNQLRAALDANHWNRSETARRLGISRTTLWRRLREDAETRGDDS